MSITPIHSDEWFEAAFTSPLTGERYEIPAGIEKATRRIIQAFRIRGVCDPMWVANIIALETGQGDGLSNFFPQEGA